VGQGAREIPRLEPDVAILDVALSDMSGFEVVRKLHSAGCRSKFIFMSVLEGQEMVQGAFTAGASGYVYKSRIAPRSGGSDRRRFQGRNLQLDYWLVGA